MRGEKIPKDKKFSALTKSKIKLILTKNKPAETRYLPASGITGGIKQLAERAQLFTYTP